MAPQKQLKIWFEAVREGGQIFFYASVDELEQCDLGQITAYYEYDKIRIKTSKKKKLVFVNDCKI